MARLATAIETTTKQEVTITAVQKLKLRKELKAWQALQDQRKVIEAAVKKHAANIGTLRETIGVDSLSFEGFKVTKVQGLSTYFDKDEFTLRGGDLELYNDCQKKKPKKPYEKVTCPGDHETVED